MLAKFVQEYTAQFSFLGVIKMSNKLAASHKKIEKVFYKMFDKGINPNDKDKRWDEDTKETYTEMVKAFATDYHRAYGTADITKMTDEGKINELIQKRIDNYHNGARGEAFNLQTLCSALKSFNLGVKETNVFKKEFTVGNPDAIRKEMKNQHVVRNSKATSTLHATPEESKSVLNNIKNQGYKTATREVAFHVGKIAMLTGGRISAILNLKTSEIIVNKESNEITFVKDKGGLTRTVKVDQETAKYLDSLRKEKGENERVFSTIRTKRDKGTFKPVKELRKEVEKIVSKAGKHLERTVDVKVKDKNGKPTTIQVTKRFTPHSFRKSFALERTSYYSNKFDSKNAIDSYVARRVEENPRIKEKLDNLRGFVNKDRKNKRDLKPIEYATFFASIDMGHFRNDVMTTFYATYKEILDYINGKK